MAGEYTAFAGAAGEKLHYGCAKQDDGFASKLAIENQMGAFGTKVPCPSLAKIELSGGPYHDKSSEEPVLELPFPVKEVKRVQIHAEEISDKPQLLASGGEISRHGAELRLNFRNGDELDFDSKTGDIHLSSSDRFQKEVQYRGTSWERVVLTSDKDSRITFAQNKISSVEHDGVRDIFSTASLSAAASEPVLPDIRELSRELTSNGFADLAHELSEVQQREALMFKKYADNPHAKEAVDSLSCAMEENAVLLEEASSVLPHESSMLMAVAEQQLRNALRDLRDVYGPGTPETRPLVQALYDHLKSENESDNDDELNRLAFESRRGGLLKDVVDNVNKFPYVDHESLPQSEAITVRKSLITMHILSGDDGLKTFVRDVNERLRFKDLVAPADDLGPFHHGAIILTPDGATRYGGSFQLIPKK